MLHLRAMEQTDVDASAVRRRHSLLVKTALTGVAAANIGSMTLHNTLKIKSRNMKSEVPDSSLTLFQRDWQDIAVLVVDETSFLSSKHLYAISARLGNIFPHKNNLPFAGL